MASNMDNSLVVYSFILLTLFRVTKTIEPFGRTPDEGWKAGGAPRPYFGSSPSNRTILSGQTAYLHCRVHMLGNRTVTWMRVRDLHILTIGYITYTGDARFEVLHKTQNDDWALQIRYSRPQDTGVYKCQVNSDPKIARNFYLKVTDKSGFQGQLYKMSYTNQRYNGYDTCITGPKERYLEPGATLTLECVLTYVKSPPSELWWYYNDRILDYNSPRGGISLKLEKTGDQTVSTLLLYSMRKEDSGNYTCLPISAPSASTFVYVEKDKARMAMHHKGSSSVLYVNDVLLLATLSTLTFMSKLLQLKNVALRTPQPMNAFH